MHRKYYNQRGKCLQFAFFSNDALLVLNELNSKFRIGF